MPGGRAVAQAMLLSRAQSCFGMRCQVMVLLAKCQAALGEARLQKQTLEKALQYCQSAGGTVNRCAH